MEEHNCEDNKIANCNGTKHIHFCSVCGKYLEETDCTEVW